MFRVLLSLFLVAFGLLARADSPNSVAISAGAAAGSGAFLSDRYFTGGSTFFANIPINRSLVTNPAPEAVYQHCRYGNFNYLIPGLEAGSPHLVRLHFAETVYTNAGARQFHVLINGSQVLSNFDIAGETGGRGIATVREFNATASPEGTISIQLTSSVEYALLSGLEVIAGYDPHPVPSPSYNLILSADQATYNAGDKARILLTTRNEPDNKNYEFFVSAQFAGNDLPLKRITANQSYGVTPALTAGSHTFLATLYVQDKTEAKSLNDAIAFYVAKIASLTEDLNNAMDPGEIAAIQAEINLDGAPVALEHPSEDLWLFDAGVPTEIRSHQFTTTMYIQDKFQAKTIRRDGIEPVVASKLNGVSQGDLEFKGNFAKLRTNGLQAGTHVWEARLMHRPRQAASAIQGYLFSLRREKSKIEQEVSREKDPEVLLKLQERLAELNAKISERESALAELARPIGVWHNLSFQVE